MDKRYEDYEYEDQIDADLKDADAIEVDVLEENDFDIDDDMTGTVQNDWLRRHYDIMEQREMIRERVRKMHSGNAVIRPAKPKPDMKDREMEVGVYARVSTMSTDQTSSIENQTLYYQKKVEDTPNWNLHEIYSDEGKSGTSMQHRTAFKRMLRAAANKEIDLIICASVSRFARNMSDCMTQVRRLRSMNPSHPVGVYFETENIYTLDNDSMQNLSIHAMLADWESANKSRRMILSYDQRICTGQYPVLDLLGYRHTKAGELIIQPEEAKTVRFVFLAYLIGYDCDSIADILTEKERPTLKGRTDWNGSMVRNIMTNERRWGDLEARKTIVIDYVDHKSKKNESDRVSAYAEGHHKGIVSPEIAKAVQMISASTRRLEGGVADLAVIPKGALKGFISVNPAWGGIDQKALLHISQQVYSEEELEQLNKLIRIWTGREHSKLTNIDMAGYEVPYGVFFLNSSMPTLTITNNSIKFNKACHSKLNNCTNIEVLYHPILRSIMIREAEDDAVNSIRWVTAEGNAGGKITTAALSEIIYQSLNWKMEYHFRFRGITKTRGNSRVIVFNLDEPQIVVPAKYKKDLAAGEDASSHYIPYKNEEDPANRIGLQYAIRKQRDAMLNVVTEQDILQEGTVAVNPLIGKIPSREEIENELEELLMSM